MSTVIINGIEYVPAKTVTGTRAAAEPVDVRHLDRSFRFDPDAQQHIPTLLVEFEPVSAVGGGDPKAKGWRDRDLLAMMLQGQPTAHIAPAEQPQPEAQPVAVVTECEACFTPDVCQLRGKCDHYSTDWLRVAPPPSAPEPSEAARLYIDGEWNSYRGELLSLALVGEDGSEWYEVIDFDGTPEPWVAANVMPKLRKAPISLEWMQDSLQRFLDRYPAGVHIVADWPEDIERFCRVLVTGPGQRLDTPPLTMEVVRIDPVSADPHNALADARALRDALRAAAAARTKC